MVKLMARARSVGAMAIVFASLVLMVGGRGEVIHDGASLPRTAYYDEAPRGLMSLEMQRGEDKSCPPFPVVVPPPQQVSSSSNHITISAEWTIIADEQKHPSAVGVLTKALALAGLKLEVRPPAAASPMAGNSIVLGVPTAEPAVLAIVAATGNVTALMSPLPVGNVESYAINVTTRAVVLLGAGDAGVFYAAQTLSQMLSPATLRLPECTVRDWPDSPLRGFRLWAAPISLENLSWVESFLDNMSAVKLNFGPLSSNAFYTAPFNVSSTPAGKAADTAFLASVKSAFDKAFVEMVPDLGFGSITNHNIAGLFPDIAEGLWIQDEPFVVGTDTNAEASFGDHTADSLLLAPVANPQTNLPLNGDFQTIDSTGVPAHWTIHPAEKGRKGSCYVDDRNPPPRDSRGKGDRYMRCDAWCNGDDGPCVGSPGFESEPINIAAGDSLFVTAWISTEANCSVPNGGPGLYLGGQACMPLDPKWTECTLGAGTTFGKSGHRKWTPFGVTFHATDAINLSLVTRMKDEGSSTDNCSWSVAHPRVLRLNAAQLNVIETKSTTINVTSVPSLSDNNTLAAPISYTRGVDFEVNAPTVAKNSDGYNADLWDMYAKSLLNRTAWRTSIRALPGGRLKVGQKVSVSYDVSAGAVGWGDWTSNPQCFGEAAFYESSCAIIDHALAVAKPRHIMTGMDEVRGVNRDSRSRRLGMSNGEIFAHAMNKLSACVHQSAVKHKLDVKPLFWYVSQTCPVAV